MDSEQQQQVVATEDTFKRWVREFRNLSAEIQEAAPTLAQMRKRKKELEEAMLTWMQNNGVERVHLKDDQYLTRNIKTSAKPLNADIIGSVLSEVFGNEEQAAEVTARIYEGRPETESEILKVMTEQKRKRLRPVGAGGAEIDGA